MTLDEIQTEIEKDSKIDESNLDHEALKIPMLHSKYYKIFIDEIKALKVLEVNYNQKRLERIHFYTGRAVDEVYMNEPLNFKVLKNELDDYLIADHILMPIKVKYDIQKEKTTMLESFIKNLVQRSYNIKNAIEFLKFKNGVV